MEPMRGFPEFIQALEPLFNSFHNLEVVIAGDDRVAYGGRVPKEGSFGLWARQKLAPWYKRGLVRLLAIFR